MATTENGELLDAFTLETDRGDIDAEIRLMHAEDGREVLWHYENGRLAFCHPARRCAECANIITDASAGHRCMACADGLALN